MSKYTAPRGTKDITPDDMPFWHYIESTSRSLFSLYNYQEIRTPVFEHTELFERGIGDSTDIVEKEMYTFSDKGDRRLTLRPEGTAPIVRAYVQHGMHSKSKVSKLYYCGPMFRYERPQAGRYRQFHQIGVESLGSALPICDAEVIAMGVHLFDELGLSGLSVAINSVGCPVCRPVIEERLKQFIGLNLEHLCGDCNRRFDSRPLRILDCKNSTCKTYMTGLPDIRDSLCHECKDHFNYVVGYLDNLGIPFQINPQLVRGLDYYTRTTFEIGSDQLGAQNALCGGGRYDGLVSQLGGPATPAVGFAFGIERAVMILQEMSDYHQRVNPLVYVAPVGFDQVAKSFLLVDRIRRAGYRVELETSKNELKTHLKQADKLNARLVLIYGEDEANVDKVLVRRMADRTQELIPFDHALEYIVSELEDDTF
ncbi:histidine--tRNA ligase [bacterium]|nr:histidine--tRNA ligase [bacterium]